MPFDLIEAPAKSAGQSDAKISWVHNGRTTIQEQRMMSLMIEQYPIAWDFKDDQTVSEMLSGLDEKIKDGLNYREGLAVVYDEELADACVVFNLRKNVTENAPLDIDMYVNDDGTFSMRMYYDSYRYRRTNMEDFEELRNNWDYILSVERMLKLEGKKLKSFRMARNAFERNYEYTVEEITPAIFDELRAFQSGAEENLQGRVEHIVEAREDNSLFVFALEHWDELKNLFGFAVRVEGRIVAYCLDEQINDTYSIGLFAKADYQYKGANQFAYWYDAKMQSARGILTTNVMDDSGETNLRFFKEHLAPIDMLKKYAVTFNGKA